MSASDRDEALKDLGRMARERREDVGLSLEDIFERTRVRMEFLRGIEQGSYQGFPDLVYIKGFVRTYLSVIGAEELKDEFMSWLNKESSPAKERNLPPPNLLGNTTYPTKGFKMASHFWLFVVLFLVLVGSSGYVWYSWSQNNVVIPRFDPSLQLGMLLSNDEQSADIHPPLSQDHNHLSLLPAIPLEEPKPARTTPYLHLIVNSEVWVEVTISERVVLSRTLQPGSEASWDLPARARVRYGRANAATVVLNGQELVNASAKGTYFYEPDGTFRRAQ